jgi:rubredoxin
MTDWKCSNCGYTLTEGKPPVKCPECGEKCEFIDVSCYIPECGGEDSGNPDTRLK